MTARLEALVEAKKRLDFEFHALRDVDYARVVQDPTVRARVLVLQQQIAAFDQELAVLDADDRWQFMFRSMLHGALADE
jgi:hypothetical protein